ncbi:MAG: LamG-like jellyroll fold domain-containing protein [Planctomycetota bacterium]
MIFNSQRIITGRCLLMFCLGLLAPCALWAWAPDPVNGWVFTPDRLVGGVLRASSGSLDGTLLGGARVESNPPALVLDGNDDRMVVEEAESPDLPVRYISVEAWVRLDSATRWGGICGYIQDNGSFERGWLLGYNNSSFSFALATDNTLTYLEASGSFELGRWYHVVGTYNGSELKIYVNGQLEGSSRSRSGDIDYADSSLVVGAYVDDDEFWPLEGKIHEVQIYDDFLAQADVREQYLARRELFGEVPAPADEPGLTGQWTFDNANVNGRLVRDRIGVFDGTIQGEYELLSSPTALALDGSSTFVRLELPGGSASLPQRELTAEAWVAVNEGTTWGGILGYMQDNGDFEKGWVLGYDDSHFSMALSSGRLTYLSGDTQFEAGTWYHVAGTYDGETLRLYVNGRLDASSSEQSGDIEYADATFVAGAYEDDNEFYALDGSLHELKLYNTALSAAQLRENFEAGRELFPVLEPVLLGPTVRFTSVDTALVSWKTALPSPSIVDYGTTRGLGRTVADESQVLDHEVTLEGLEPGTPYFYQLRHGGGGREAITPVYEFSTEFNFSVPSVEQVDPPFALDADSPAYAQAAERILALTGIDRGYCLDLDCGRGRLAVELAKRSKLRIIGVSPDRDEVAAGRVLLRESGLYGSRITLHRRPLQDLPYAENSFNLVVSDRLVQGALPRVEATEMFRLLKPSGGVGVFGQPLAARNAVTLESVRGWLGAVPVDSEELGPPGNWAGVVRGALEGAGEWSHMYGSADNSATSHDELVEPSRMRIQWYGRPGPRGMIDRQPRQQSPLYVNGRLYSQGNDRIYALDAYNGTVLWSLEVPGMRRVNIPRDTGNMCADADSLFITVKNSCWRLDGRTGRLEQVYTTGDGIADKSTDWGYAAVVGEQLIGSRVAPDSSYSSFSGPDKWYDETSGGFGTSQVISSSLFSVAREDGRMRWSHDAGAILNSTITIGGGRLYYIESTSSSILNAGAGRTGSADLWRNNFLVALDAASGEILWRQSVTLPSSPSPVVAYLLYSDERLITAVANSRYHVTCYSAANGERQWERDHSWNRNHHGGHMYHPLVVGDKVIVEPRGYELATGSVVFNSLPSRGGCSTMSAAARTVVYVDWDYDNGSFGFWNVDSGARVQKAGSRGSCWLGLISGGGMVFSPTASSGCVCRYPLQTSIGYSSW